MQITIKLPNDFVAFQSIADIEKDMRLSYSLWLFKNSRVMLAKAAELAGLDIYDFMTAWKQNEVAVIDISKEELPGRAGRYEIVMIPVVKCSALIALTVYDGFGVGR
jgi:predicted HTH domain antitoxin